MDSIFAELVVPIMFHTTEAYSILDRTNEQYNAFVTYGSENSFARLIINVSDRRQLLVKVYMWVLKSTFVSIITPRSLILVTRLGASFSIQYSVLIVNFYLLKNIMLHLETFRL